MNEQIKGMLAVTAGAWIFGTAGVFVKNLDMPATALAGFRLLAPALLLLILFPELGRKLIQKHDSRLMLASCLTTLRILLWVLGLLWAPMSKAIIVLFSWPLIFTCMGFVSGYEAISWKKIALVIMGFSGIIMLQGGDSLSWDSDQSKGLICMFGSACLFAFNMFIFKNALHTSSPMEVVLRDSIVGSIFFLPFIGLYIGDFSSNQIVAALTYGSLIGLGGYGLIFFGLARIKASSAAVLSYAEVLSACLCGVLVFHDVMSPLAWLGGGLIIATSFLCKNI